MRTITLTQPWATLVAIGAKRIETRSWPTSYRGELAVHAAKYRNNAEIHDTVMQPAFYRALLNESGGLVAIPSGAIVAVCRLAGCELTDQVMSIHAQDVPGLTLPEQEIEFGNFSSGRYAWFLEDVRQLREPIPAKGALGLWEWTPPADLDQLLVGAP
jgi:hypothetical protein